MLLLDASTLDRHGGLRFARGVLAHDIFKQRLRRAVANHKLEFDLQQLSASIEATGSCQRRLEAAEAHAEAVFLELALLRNRCSQLCDRRVLTVEDLHRLHATVDDVQGLLTFEPARLSSHALRSIDRAQNRLFDEVQEIALQCSALGDGLDNYAGEEAPDRRGWISRGLVIPRCEL